MTRYELWYGHKPHVKDPTLSTPVQEENQNRSHATVTTSAPLPINATTFTHIGYSENKLGHYIEK